MEDLRVLTFLHIPQGLLLAWAAVVLSKVTSIKLSFSIED